MSNVLTFLKLFFFFNVLTFINFLAFLCQILTYKLDPREVGIKLLASGHRAQLCLQGKRVGHHSQQVHFRLG
jgi:hypothetical protein